MIGKYSGAILFSILIGIYVVQVLGQAAHSDPSPVSQIKNPFYSTPQWKLWRSDNRPVVMGPIKLSPPPVNIRRYPVDVDPTQNNGEFISFRGSDWPGRTYAGMWDDVYASFDNRHSYIPSLWTDASGNGIQLQNQHMHLVYKYARKAELLHGLGLTFTSQSTTGMGHALIDSFSKIQVLERDYCFANILRAGPAHISYREDLLARTRDEYDAIMPCYFNSIGGSKSEINALAKMLLVGAHLPKKTKNVLKQHGLYIPTLLYIWKAGLPYDVPYTNELRHRVVYASSGKKTDPYLQAAAPVNEIYHRYDETSHQRNMVEMAKGMVISPPIAILKKLEIHGGIEKSVNKTTIRIHQQRGKAVHMRISAVDSFDLQDRPLTYQWSVLYGNTPVSVEVLDGGKEAQISVPFTPKLPKGRTVILLTVNNGYYDSNPATINVYRPDGTDNLRPSLAGLANRTVLAGEPIKFDIESTDPEGFSPILYRWSNDFGTLDGNRFTWKTPDVSSPLQKHLHLIAADGTGGYNSAQVMLTVTPTLAVIEADWLEGKAPLKVQFSAIKSRDKAGNRVTYKWDFDDGSTATEANVVHTFTAPGFYEVSLTVSGPFGSHTAHQVIYVRHTWAKVLNNGWRFGKLDAKVWNPIGSEGVATIHESKRVTALRIAEKSKDIRQIGVESVNSFKVPIYLEATFMRPLARVGNGIEVLGSLIGYLNRAHRNEVLIGYQQTPGKWTGLSIGRYMRLEFVKTQLQLFVDDDPNHPGRIRYAGYLESELGRNFFRFDNQPKRDNRLRILSHSRSGSFDIQAFKVWAPRQ